MALTLVGVRYGYAGSSRPAIADIHLELGPGTVTGVVGANESGKSTLCLVAAGIAPATIGGSLEGTVAIDDLDTRSARPWQLAQRCGILSQDPLSQLSGTSPTVWEEVAFGPRNLGLSLSEVIDRVASALALLGIEDLAERDPARLSGGQGQLVVLAGVLAMRPPYLVLDEPTSQLDPAGTLMVGSALRRVADGTDTAILIAEHKTELLAAIADRVAVMDRGALVRIDAAADVLADPTLDDLGVVAPAAVRVLRRAVAAGVDTAALRAVGSAS